MCKHYASSGNVLPISMGFHGTIDSLLSRVTHFAPWSIRGLHAAEASELGRAQRASEPAAAWHAAG